MGYREEFVWLFDGGGIFPAGMFPTRERAEARIAEGRMSGTLSKYSSIMSFADWVVTNEVFKPLNERRPQLQSTDKLGTNQLEVYQFVDGTVV